MFRLVLAALLASLSVGLAGVTVALGDPVVDLSDNVRATRERGATVDLRVRTERRVGASIVAVAYGEGTVLTDPGADRGRYRLAIEGTSSPRGEVDVLVRDGVVTLRSDALTGIVADGTWVRTDLAAGGDDALAAVVRGHVGDLPLGIDAPLALVASLTGQWRRDAPETLAHGGVVQGWVARPDVATFLAALPPEQVERWELQLVGIDEPEVLVRAHLGQRGAVRRVELLVRGDASGRLLERRHVLELGERGRSFSTNPEPGATVRDLRGSVGA